MLIHEMCLKITLLKLQPYLPGDNVSKYDTAILSQLQKLQTNHIVISIQWVNPKKLTHKPDGLQQILLGDHRFWLSCVVQSLIHESAAT